ncbi:MAG: cation diffusion facilitator family transporter [Geodermatophilaceae bacterium]
MGSHDHDRGAAAAPGTDQTRGSRHAGHSHGVSTASADTRYLVIALVVIVGFMVVEVVVAVLAHSLALFSDAGHMLTDAGAISVSLWAIRLAARPATGVWTFGWKRAEILSAAGNGITLLVVSGIVTFGGAARLLASCCHEAGTSVAAPPTSRSTAPPPPQGSTTPTSVRDGGFHSRAGR